MPARFIPTSYDALKRIGVTILSFVREDDLFYRHKFFDFGAGDGRVIEWFEHVAGSSQGMEIDADLAEQFNDSHDNIERPGRIIHGDFLKDPFPSDITIAFASLADSETHMRLMGRLMEECPKLRIIITNIQYLPLAQSLYACVLPPELDEYLLELRGNLDLLKQHTLEEILRDGTRQVLGKTDKTVQADFVAYIYVKK